MSELLDSALERWEGWTLGDPFDASTLDVILDAARRVANLDIEAATEVMADGLHRIVILPGRFKLAVVAQATVDAALGITTKDDNGD